MTQVLSPDGLLIAQNIESALGEEKTAAMARAMRIDADVKRLRALARRPRRALNALRREPSPLTPADWQWLLEERSAPLLLAFPLTMPALAVIARLFAAGRHFLCIEETALTAPLLGFLAELHGGRRAMVGQPAAMIKHRRTTAPAKLGSVIYVTFPDHHRATVATSRMVRFFGAEHYAPITEPLLYFRGVSPVVTLTPEGLARYDAAPHVPVIESDAVDLLQWLATHVEAFIRHGGSELLSWVAFAQRTPDAERLNRGVEARMVEGFLRTWQKSHAAVDDETFRWSLGELARIHTGRATRELR